MTEVRITCHAIERYIERVDGRLAHAEAEAEIRSHSRAIEVAARFGCQCVKLGNGARLMLNATTVVTVLDPAWRTPNWLPSAA